MTTKCYRCTSSPCQCTPQTATLRRLILGELTTGKLLEQNLSERIDTMYVTARMTYPSIPLWAAVLDDLVRDRRVTKTEGKWEGDVFYALCRVKPKPERMLF